MLSAIVGALARTTTWCWCSTTSTSSGTTVPLAGRVPRRAPAPPAHLVLLTRADPGLRLGRLRASGGLLEIRADDLGFTEDEASVMLERDAVDLHPDSFGLLMQRTEGWPAGLYLASLSLTGRPAPDALVRIQRRQPIHRRLPDGGGPEPAHRPRYASSSWRCRCSTASRPRCATAYAVLGSAALLRELERTDLFLVPLDDDGHWYRFHPLFAAVARSELEISPRPDDSTLHPRAADWFTVHGNVDEAVKHSIAAGDTACRATGPAPLAPVRRCGTYCDRAGLVQAIGPATTWASPAQA